MATNDVARTNIARLILIPSVISLGITLLRLIGELQHWSPSLFSREPGGGGALVGISWLAPVFGIYFALRLSRADERPASAGRSIVFAVLGFVMVFLGSIVAFAQNKSLARLVLGLLIIIAAAIIQYFGWPKLFKVLLAYGYAARIPVAIVMFFAIRGNWGTHYDVVSPDEKELSLLSFWPKYLLIGLLPQLIFWVAFTIVTGSLFGSIAAAIFGRRKPVEPLTAPTLAKT